MFKFRMENKELEIVSNKMNVLINLLMDLNESLNKKTPLKEKISYLVRNGLKDNKEIAKILNTTEGMVSKEKSLGKKNG